LKIAVIDLGYNSEKLANYDVKSSNSFKTVQEYSIKARLGEGISEQGLLCNESVSRAIEGLKFFREIIHLKSIKQVLPIATSAVREAKNKEDFLRKVYKETDFEFRVLSPTEEALYSYLGASRATCIPNLLFFDLGGGSLEIVVTRDYKVLKIISLPLGALRLSEKYSMRGDGTFSDKEIFEVERQVLKVLPNSKDVKICGQTQVIAVGGSIRAIARYDQKIKGYPFNILHNYVIDYQSIQLIKNKLCKLKSSDIVNIDVIGNNRGYTITAASVVVQKLMEKFEIPNLIVSTQGLREGCLLEHVNNLSGMRAQPLDEKRIQHFVRDACKPPFTSNYTVRFARMLTYYKLINKREYEILLYANKSLSERLVEYNQVDAIFYLIMTEVFPRLTHEDQLILALSLVFRQKPKAAEKLYRMYKGILKFHNEKSIQKIAVCIDLTEIFERHKARVELSKSYSRRFLMKITAKSRFLPQQIINDKIKMFESAFDIGLTFLILEDKKNLNKLINSYISYSHTQFE
jgi:exopolyphosphatase / guanosine-5'-triphosphate,3'-diphosphate pyrophosphatase